MTTKDKVLSELSKNQGSAISGEELALVCGVSRAAIWKAVNSLRNAGIAVNGTPNGGYELSKEADPINAQIITNCLKKSYPEFAKSNVECFESIDSTNLYAKKLLLAGEPKKLNRTIIVSQSQSAGRGRLGRSFVSPAGTGIYISLIWAPEGGIKEASRLTALCAVGVCRALTGTCGIKPSIKWINDVYYHGRKICGILAEGVTSFETGVVEAAVIGIGINIKSSKELEDAGLGNIAGGLDVNQSNLTIHRAELAAAVAGEVFAVLEQDDPSLMEEYKSLLFMLHQEVTVTSVSGAFAPYSATAVDVDEEAALIVQLPDGTTRKLVSAEVSAKPSGSV